MAKLECNEGCRARVECARCKKIKAPRGRSVPLAAAGGYCDFQCDGYYRFPFPPHLWPGEELPRDDEADETTEAAKELETVR